MVVPFAVAPGTRLPISTCSPVALVVWATARARYPRTAGVPAAGAAGVQVSRTPPATFTALTSVGPGGPDCSGPFGQPPKPGPPTSPNSAIVTPCRLLAAS